MGVLTVTNVPDEVVAELRARAVQHGVTAEEEHRRILREALMKSDATAEAFKAHLLTEEFVVDELPILARARWPERDIGL